MAAKKTLEGCIDWIYEQQTTQESAEYGRNHRSTEDALKDQQDKDQKFKDYKKEVDKFLDDEDISDEDSLRLQTAYDSLTVLSSKRLECLKNILDITSLEEFAASLNNQVVKTTVGMVRSTSKEVSAGGRKYADESAYSQECIFAVRENWLWMEKLVDCIKVHLKHASDYHQFFHEVDELDPWLQVSLSRLHKSQELRKYSKGDLLEAQHLLQEMQEFITAYRQWQIRTDAIWERARQLVPVHMRTQPVITPEPIRSICDYKTKQINVRDGEDLLLLDNSDSTTWKVRNRQGKEAEVPSLVCVIPPPFKEALEAAVRIRLQLLAAWTFSVKRLGKRLIQFMSLVFRDWSDKEIKVIQNIKPAKREDLLTILDYIEDSLHQHWGDYAGFINLQERILSLRMILEEGNGGSEGDDENVHNAIVVQITMLEKLMKKYKELWDTWEQYKVILEASRQPELMLIVDKWEQLKYISTTDFIKYWMTELELEPSEKDQGVLITDVTDLDEFGEKIVGKETTEGETKTGKEGEAKSGDEQKVDEDKPFTVGMIEAIVRRESLKATPPGGGGQQVHAAGMSSEGYGGEMQTAGSLGGGGSYQQQVVRETVTSSQYGALGSAQGGGGQGGVNAMRTQTIHTASSSGGSGSGGFSTITETVEGGDGVRSMRTETVRTGSGVSGVSGSVVDGGFGSGGMGILPGGCMVNQGGEGQQRVVMSSGQNVMGMGAFDEAESFDESVEGFGQKTVVTNIEGVQVHGGADQMAISGVTESRIAETDQISHAEREEKKTFHIRSVTDPRSGDFISLQQAIMLGIIDPDKGMYVNPIDGTSMPIPIAMGSGKIQVEFTSTKRSREKKIAYGLITVKSMRERQRSYTIKAVTDPNTGKEISLEEAQNNKIIDTAAGMYVDIKTGSDILMSDAIDQGKVKVEYDDSEEEANKTINKTYIVRAVVDQRLRTVVPFHEAVSRGIIEKDTGAYVNNKTGEKMYVGDAIMRGFLKAREVEKDHALDVDPANHMVIDRVDTIKKKLLRPIHVIKMFKNAAKMMKK